MLYPCYRNTTVRTLIGTLVFIMLSQVSQAEEKPKDLAAAARDPTASLTAVAIRYDFIESFHNLPGADQTQLVVQPIIPWKWGKYQHITRITLPYVTSGPDWGLLSDEAATGRKAGCRV